MLTFHNNALRVFGGTVSIRYQLQRVDGRLQLTLPKSESSSARREQKEGEMGRGGRTRSA